MIQYKKNISLFIIGLSLLVFFGCPKKPQPVPETQQEEVTLPPQKTVEEPSIRGEEEFQSVAELKNVYFDFDRFELTEEAKTILQKNAEYLLAHPEYEVLIEGHTCECGTNEYNLGLGQKRANAVREYYISLGVSAGKVATISYGEEKPVNKNAGPPDSPLCKLNRRAETKVRIKK